MRKHPVDEHYPQLVAHLKRILGCPHLARDAAQEAYRKAYPASAGKAHWRAALFVTGKRIALDMLRRKEVRDRPREGEPLLSEPRVLGSALDQLLHSERLEKLDEIISELRPSQQEIIRLRFKDGMSREDAARALRISVGALEQRTTRALAHIRKRMKKLFGNPSS